MRNRSSRIALIGIFVLFMSAVALFSYYEYTQNKEKLYRQIDDKLLTSAIGASMILSEEFHDRATTPSAVSPAEDRRNIERLSHFARHLNIMYVYTLTRQGGKIHFTASSATDEEWRSGANLTRYYDSYDDASDELHKAFQSGQTRYDEYTDRWGTFRSVFVPMTTPSGVVYVAAADIRIDAIHRLLKEEAISLMVRMFIILALGLFLLGWRLMYVNRHLIREKESLEQEIEKGEKHLRQTNTELNAILNATEESIFLLDREGTILTINRTAAARLNKEPSQLQGKCVYDCFPPEVSQRRRRNVEQVFETGEILHIEDQREGMFFSLHYYPVFDDNGTVKSIVVFAQDITERKKAQITLKSTYERLQNLFDSMSEGVYEVDTDGNCTMVNKAFLRILGYDRAEELLGKNIHEMIHHSHADGAIYPKNRCVMLNVLKNGSAIHVDNEVFWSRQGEAIAVEYWSNPILIDGRAVGAMATFVDIRERKKLENELRKLTMAVEQSPNSIIITDHEGNIEYVNAAFSNMTGYARSEVIGKNPKFLHSGKTPPETFREMWNRLRRGESWAGEFINRSKDGTEYILSVEISPFGVDDSRVSHYMAIEENITDKKRSEDHIRHLTDYDSLTGLPNRQKLQLDIDLLHPHACAILNIDSFKEMNDFFGIASGDALLRMTGEWLVRMGFSPYRIGGDEFAVLFYEKLTQEELYSRISALMTALDEERFVVGDETLDMHMTAGVAMGEGKLLTRADIAIHTAKERKIQIAFYEEAENIEEQYRVNIAMAGAIRKALVGGRIVCYYQPIVNISTGKTEKYETLVRLIDEEGQIVPPMQFLPIAKKTKLYPRITKEVIHQACRVFADRTEEFSLNISIADIHDPSTVQEILSTITRTGTASRIVFEILESEGIENYSEVAEFIHTVKRLGAKIAIDDFGTGYSNFEHVLRLNVDYLKIDGSLIQGTAQNPRNRLIVETIVDFATKIGTKTIAEFVSDEATFTTVKELGIDFSQGYYSGKPDRII